VRKRQWIALCKLPLVPIRIRRSDVARRIKSCYLLGREVPACCAKILPQLLFVARANNHATHCRPLQEPAEGNVGNGLPVSFATSSSASITRYKYSSSTCGPNSAVL
jgi:hypothetical protein